ncbi:MAG: recombinase family protein [Bdellovibrio sp.]
MNKIACLTFSSRSTVVKYLKEFKIELRVEDLTAGTLPFGSRRYRQKKVPNEQEQSVIKRAKELRGQGLSYKKIANIMNTVGIRTKTGRTKWYAKTVRDIILRSN